MFLSKLTVLIANNIKPGVPFTQGRCKQNQESAKVTPKEKCFHPQVEALTGNTPWLQSAGPLPTLHLKGQSGGSSLLSTTSTTERAVLRFRFANSVDCLLDKASTVSLALTGGAGDWYKPRKAAQSPILVNHLKSAWPKLKGWNTPTHSLQKVSYKVKIWEEKTGVLPFPPGRVRHLSLTNALNQPCCPQQYSLPPPRLLVPSTGNKLNRTISNVTHQKKSPQTPISLWFSSAAVHCMAMQHPHQHKRAIWRQELAAKDSKGRQNCCFW